MALLIATGVAGLGAPSTFAADTTVTPAVTSTIPGDAPAAEIQTMKKAWVSRLVGTDGQYDTPLAQQLIARVNNGANKAWASMVTSDVADREYMWPDRDGKWAETPDRYFRDGFDGLKTLTLGWATPGTDLYQDDQVKKEIIAGLDHMVAKGYNGETSFGNWWSWQIGGAQRFTDIVMLLDAKGALTSQQVTSYAQIISRYAPTPEKQLMATYDNPPVPKPLVFSDEPSAGANRIDISLVVLGTGLLLNDAQRIHMAVDGINDYMDVTDGNGFRDDGSYVDHSSFAYTGGYGEALLKALGRILGVTAGTSFAPEQQHTQALGRSITMGVLPNMYRGVGVPSLKGRGLTRKTASGPGSWCSDAVFDLVGLSGAVPASDRAEILNAARYWIDTNTKCFDNLAKSFSDLDAMATAVSQGQQLESRPDQGMFIFPQMDRFISRNKDYVFNLGLYSDRISSYEVGAAENIRGWHYADGMTYLFNGDSMQFHGDYWPTVDPYRLPGTTVDTRALPDDLSSYKERPGVHMDATGGVATAALSAIGQHIDKSDWVINDGTDAQQSNFMDLKATKSWFVFPNAIVALGAGITGTTAGNSDADGKPASIETVVDNRIIGDSLYTVTDGQGNDLGAAQDDLNAVIYRPAHTAAPIKYVMLDGTKAHYRKVSRTASWNDINHRQKFTEDVSNTFGTVTIDHGATADNSTYAYMIIPGQAALAGSADDGRDRVRVVSNTAAVQSVETTDGTEFAGNVFAADGATLPRGYRATTALSVVGHLPQDSNEVQLTVSDPSQKLDRVSLVTPVDVVSASGEGVVFDAVTHTLTIDTAGKKGRSVRVSLMKTPRSTPSETTTPALTPRLGSADSSSRQAPQSSKGMGGVLNSSSTGAWLIGGIVSIVAALIAMALNIH